MRCFFSYINYFGMYSFISMSHCAVTTIVVDIVSHGTIMSCTRWWICIRVYHILDVINVCQYNQNCIQHKQDFHCKLLLIPCCFWWVSAWLNSWTSNLFNSYCGFWNISKRLFDILLSVFYQIKQNGSPPVLLVYIYRVGCGLFLCVSFLYVRCFRHILFATVV